MRVDWMNFREESLISKARIFLNPGFGFRLGRLKKQNKNLFLLIFHRFLPNEILSQSKVKTLDLDFLLKILISFLLRRECKFPL
jgi:hypothetical protein